MALKHKAQILALFICLFGLAANRAAAQSFPQWGNLKPGPHAVGFRLIQKYDYSRRVKPATDFAGVSTGETAYPVQIGLWYPAIKPATAQPLSYEELMLMELKRDNFTPISAEDHESVRNTIKSLAAGGGQNVAALDEVIKQTLETRTASFKDVSPASGRFPVVLVGCYVLTNASVLCEYLASHGYVVLFAPTTTEVSTLQGTNQQLAINDRVRAFEYLTAEAHTLPFANANKLAVIGLNFDGMPALIYQMRNMNASALVSINGWETIRPNNEGIFASLYLNRLKMRVPYLNFHWDQPNAQPADLRLIESLKYSERLHLVVDGLDHEGLITNPLALPFSGAKRKVGHEFLIKKVASFLDRYVKGIPSAEQALRAKPEADGFPANLLKTDWKQAALPPVPYDAEFARVLWDQKDLAQATKIFREARAANPEVQLFSENELNMYVFRFNRMGRKAEVLAVRQLVAEAYPKSMAALVNLGGAYVANGQTEEALKNYDRAFELGPGANNRGVAYFNLGCGYSLVGKKEKALAALEKAVAEGFTTRRNYETDEDLASLRAEPRFQQLLARLPQS